jgi:hypothetical protein
MWRDHMSDQHPKGGEEGGKSTTQMAIADIVKMTPRSVTVTLTLPVSGARERPVLQLEWTREDTNMPLSELLGRIEAYVVQFGTK